MKQCPKCNFKTARNDDKFCAICGESLETVAGTSVCSSCGAELFPHARFCTRCGTQPSSFGPTLSTARDQSSETSISVKGIGLVRAVKISCSVVAGDLFAENSDEAYMWLTDDANRLPVYVKAELKMGSVVGRLVYWEGLKNNFTSLTR